ncbi:MAG TPA: hypothetical protein VMN78_00970 [Longimicrobiales bacterium]|nr:hypothetical protein [Longimicrobiales bacterium]
MTEWRLIIGDGSPGSGALESDGGRNMAVDQVLLDSVKAGGRPTLRFYRWKPACLSLGRNQPARDRYDADGPTPGIHVVRRPTGGLAVFHDQELTYSVACRVGDLGSPRATYLRVHRAIAAGLASLGAETALSPRRASRAPVPADPAGVCFHSAAEGEVLAPAGKLVGSAQRCEQRSILQHGSILLDGSQERAGAAVVRKRAGAAPAAVARVGGVATLTELLGRRPAEAELLSAIAAGFTASMGIRLAPAWLAADEAGRLEAAEARYRSENWTWRT